MLHFPLAWLLSHFPLSWQNKTERQLELHTILASIKANNFWPHFCNNFVMLFNSAQYPPLHCIDFARKSYHFEQKWRWPNFGPINASRWVSVEMVPNIHPIIKFQNFHSSFVPLPTFWIFGKFCHCTFLTFLYTRHILTIKFLHIAI